VATPRQNRIREPVTLLTLFSSSSDGDGRAGGPFKPFFGLSGAFFLVASRTYRRGSQVTAQKPGGNRGHRAKEY
jgi:hypothetical protein